MPEEFRLLSRSIISTRPAGPHSTAQAGSAELHRTGHGSVAGEHPADRGRPPWMRPSATPPSAARRRPNRRMDLIEAFAYPFPVTVISDMLGIPREDRETIRGWTENLLRVDRLRGQEVDEETRAGLREFTDYLKDLFDRKHRTPTDDMISRLVHVEEEGDILDEEEMLATVFLMFLAGHVTTVNLIGNGVVALLTHPDELAKFKANPELGQGGGRGDAALLGTGRLHRPAHRKGGRRGGRDGDPDRRTGDGQPRLGQQGSRAVRQPGRLSTSRAPTPTGTSPSARASTSVSGRRSRASKGRSPSTRCSDGIRICGWRFPPRRCSGVPASCAGSRACRFCSEGANEVTPPIEALI